MTTPAGPGPGPPSSHPGPSAPCSLCPSTWPATCPEPCQPPPLLPVQLSLGLWSQPGSPCSPSSLPSQAWLGPKLGLRPPDAWSSRWGPSTCHPLGWASCPDQDLVEVAPAPGPGCALVTERPHRPRGLVRAPGKHSAGSLTSRVKTNNTTFSKEPLPDSSQWRGTPLGLMASQPGTSRPPTPSAQLPPAFLTRTSCWSCPAESLTHRIIEHNYFKP